MEGCQREGSRDHSGGIISLAKHIDEHREAIEYDLMVRTGHELNDLGRTLSWSAFRSFLKKLDIHSALLSEINPELSVWADQTKTNAILADIYDVLASINANLIAIGTRKAARPPKPYKRPGKQERDDSKQFGSGALPPAELHAWIERKRAEYNARNSTGDDHGNSGPERRTAEDH